MNKCMERIYNGVVKENPTFVLMLGSYDISNKWSRNGAFLDGSACYVKYADIYAAQDYPRFGKNACIHCSCCLFCDDCGFPLGRVYTKSV